MFVSEERNKGERERENENMNVRKIHNFFALVRDFPKNGGNKIINKAGFFLRAIFVVMPWETIVLSLTHHKI